MMEVVNSHPSDSRTMPIQDHEILETTQPISRKTKNPPKTKWVKYVDYQANWLEKTRGNLMVVATVIASMAFQAGLNPPKELWGNESQNKQCKLGEIKDAISNGRILEARNLAVTCINKYNSYEFIICNTVSFSASLSIIFLLTILPLRNKFSLWIMLLAISVTLIFTSATYIVSISMAEGSTKKERFNNELVLYYVLFWVGLLVLIVVFLLLRLVFKLLVKLVTCICSCCCCWRRRKKRIEQVAAIRV